MLRKKKGEKNAAKAIHKSWIVIIEHIAFIMQLIDTWNSIESY